MDGCCLLFDEVVALQKAGESSRRGIRGNVRVRGSASNGGSGRM